MRLAVHLSVAVALALGLAWLGIERGSMGAVFVGIGVALIYAVAVSRRPYRRWVGRRTPLSSEAREALERIRFYRLLDDAGQAKFAHRVQLLLAEYDFEAVGGTLDDEIRVLAVAGAAVLVHHLDDAELPARRSILIYPDSFDDDYGGHGKGNILGMVHRQGPIIFSSKSLRRGWKSDTDGHNVSIHEWAHVLDLMDGYADGVPDVSDQSGWDETVKEELLRVRKGRSVLRDYAGTNRAELFAVSVEVFFERPRKLADRHPELYERMVKFFGVDPCQAEPPRAGVAGTRKKKKRKKRKR